MLDKTRLQELSARARHDVDVGLEYGGVEGCSLAIGYRGEIVFAEAYGAAKIDTPILIMSPTKTIMEAALWVLYGRGLIAAADRVTDYVPEFGTNGKETITLEMLETHTSAIANQMIDHPDHADRQKRLAAFRGWSAEGVPGTYYEYHIGSGNWVLAEIIERVSGMDYRAFLKKEVLEPLGLADIRKVSLGEPEELQKLTLKHINCSRGWTSDRAKLPPVPHSYDREDALAVGVPGSGAVGTPTGVALLYQAYLHNPGELWKPDVLEDARSRVRVRAPDPMGRPIVRSLSFHLGDALTDRYGERSFFGEATSARTFGHQGQGGQIAWDDPVSGLSFCYLTNTVVFPPGGCFHPRARELSTLAAQVLGS